MTSCKMLGLFVMKLIAPDAKSIVVIGGPTASGKSGLAIRIAERYDGVIINADSVQVYNGIPIISAQPTSEQQALLPHKLYGVLSVRDHCNLGKWLIMAKQEIDTALAYGKLPIIVGGTGFYIDGLINGVIDVPDIPHEDSRTFRQNLSKESVDILYKQLLALDPVGAKRIDPNNKQRIIRALEASHFYHMPFSNLLTLPKKLICERERFIQLLVMPSRDILYEQCDKRFDRMLARGAIEEVRWLMAQNVPPNHSAMQALGIPHLRQYIEGNILLREAIFKAKTATRNYAKRQITWFKNHMQEAVLVAV
jgi:tRNA dimethylallyltransferase